MADRGRGGKTKSRNGQAWSSASSRGQWRTGKNGMDRPGVQQVPEGGGEQGKMEDTGCEIIWGAPTTLAVNE